MKTKSVESIAHNNIEQQAIVADFAGTAAALAQLYDYRRNTMPRADGRIRRTNRGESFADLALSYADRPSTPEQSASHARFIGKLSMHPAHCSWNAMVL